MLASSLLSKIKLSQVVELSALCTSTALISLRPSLHQNKNELHTSRYQAFKSDLKIKWVRPEKIQSIDPRKSGDLSEMPKLDMNQLHDDYKDCAAIQELSEEQKKLYTLTFLRKKKSNEMLKNQAIVQVQRHHLDNGSMEAKIAFMTARIRIMQADLEICRFDKKRKVALKELIDRRKKFLKYLRRWDYKRFEWLLEKLDIVYHPHPEKYERITRKDSLRQLTNEHCENIREERLQAYRKTLEEEKVKFTKEKEEILKWIEEEERACGVIPTSLQDSSPKDKTSSPV